MSNTTKLYGFIGGLCLLILLAIGFAFKPTFNLYSKIDELKEKIKLNGNLDEEIATLQGRLKPLNERGNMVDWVDYNQYALAEITGFATENKVKIIQFQPTLSKEFESFRGNLFQVELEGSYIRLLKTLKQIEHQAELGEVISTKFYLHKARKTKIESVHVIVYLQRLEPKNQE